MKSSIQHAASTSIHAVVGIDPRDEVVIRDAAGFRVECLHGSVRITSADRSRPIVLCRGEHCSICCGGPATLHALTPAQCELTVDPAQRLGLGRIPTAADRYRVMVN